MRPIGSSLGKVARISAEQVPAFLKEVEIEILTDVDNPLCGARGATTVFGGQKGLSPLLFSQVDQAVADFYQLVNPQVIDMGGAGAGGGMAAGLVAFAGGKIVSGIETCLDLLDFDERVKKADLVVVGEGRLDRQSLAGKAPVGSPDEHQKAFLYWRFAAVWQMIYRISQLRIFRQLFLLLHKQIV